MSPCSLVSGPHGLCSGSPQVYPLGWCEHPHHLPGVALESLVLELLAFIVFMVALQGLKPDVVGHVRRAEPSVSVGPF